MASEPAASPDSAPDHEVMASIDGERTDTRLVIADITADDAWLSIPTPAAVRLDDWR